MLQETVIFRATDELAAAIQNRASEAGLNVSEYLRAVISEHVGVREAVSPVCVNIANAAFFSGEDAPVIAAMADWPLRKGEPDPDPFDLIPRAGKGDLQAQRDLADMAILAALSGKAGIDPLTAVSEGLILARLAQSHGDIDDAMRVVTMLALGSMLTSGDAARDMAGEAIARLELIADGSSHMAEDAADLLTNCAAREQRETMQIAKV